MATTPHVGGSYMLGGLIFLGGVILRSLDLMRSGPNNGYGVLRTESAVGASHFIVTIKIMIGRDSGRSSGLETQKP